MKKGPTNICDIVSSIAVKGKTTSVKQRTKSNTGTLLNGNCPTLEHFITIHVEVCYWYAGK